MDGSCGPEGYSTAFRPISQSNGSAKYRFVFRINPVLHPAELFLIHYTDSNVPYWDGLTTSIFILGMWLMA